MLLIYGHLQPNARLPPTPRRLAHSRAPCPPPPPAAYGGRCTRVAQAYDGATATGGESGAASVQRQQAVLRRCLARAHELRLPELAALASLARHILPLLY